MKKIHMLLAAILLSAIFFAGCKKDLYNTATKSSKNSSIFNLAANDSTVINTPFGPRYKADVHFIDKAFQLNNANGRLQKVEKATGRVVEDFGVQTPLKKLPPNNNMSTVNRAVNEIKPAKSTNGLISPALGSGWITYAYWNNSAGSTITNFTTTWTVPHKPTVYQSQLLYLFNGIENSADILQPVLQFGPNGIWGGNYWTVDNWYAGCQGCGAYYGVADSVAVGTVLTGVMTQTGTTGSNFNYLSSFTGQPVANQLAMTNVPKLFWATESMEAYNMQQFANYPIDLKVPMTSMVISSGSTHLQPTWTVTNAVTDVGQHTIMVNDNPNAGEVDLYFHYGNDVFSNTYQKNNCSTGYYGTYITYTVPANKYVGATLLAANTQASADLNANGQNYANTNGVCLIGVNFAINNSSGNSVNATFTRTDQSQPNISQISNAHTGTVHVIIPYGTYTVTVSPSSMPVNCNMMFNTGQSYGPAPGHQFTGIVINPSTTVSLNLN